MLTHLLSITLRWEGGGTKMWVIFVGCVLNFIHVLLFLFVLCVCEFIYTKCISKGSN